MCVIHIFVKEEIARACSTGLDGWRQRERERGGGEENMCDIVNDAQKTQSLEPRSHPDPLIDTAMAAHATEQAWEQIAFGSCPKFLIQKTFEMGTSEVRFYEWWSMLQEAWLKASLDISRQLKEIFHAHDENKDGVLDFDEFHKMIASFLNEEQLRLQGCDAGRLFSLCLEETSDLAKRSNIDVEDDIILPQAFVNVARMKRLDRHLVCPYPTSCCHAEYPDPCESP